MLISQDHPQNMEIEVGELLTVVVVKAANVGKDTWSSVKGLVGGNLGHYENLIQNAIDEALKKLDTKAKDSEYDGVIGVKISHPMVVTGAVEVIVYGNGFKKITELDY